MENINKNDTEITECVENKSVDSVTVCKDLVYQVYEAAVAIVDKDVEVINEKLKIIYNSLELISDIDKNTLPVNQRYDISFAKAFLTLSETYMLKMHNKPDTDDDTFCNKFLEDAAVIITTYKRGKCKTLSKLLGHGLCQFSVTAALLTEDNILSELTEAFNRESIYAPPTNKKTDDPVQVEKVVSEETPSSESESESELSGKEYINNIFKAFKAATSGRY